MVFIQDLLWLKAKIVKSKKKLISLSSRVIIKGYEGIVRGGARREAKKGRENHPLLLRSNTVDFISLTETDTVKGTGSG